jgi:hypothetical protein
MHFGVSVSFYYILIRTCFGHTYVRLLGGEDKNTAAIIVCRSHSTAKNHVFFFC